MHINAIATLIKWKIAITIQILTKLKGQSHQISLARLIRQTTTHRIYHLILMQVFNHNGDKLTLYNKMNLWIIVEWQ